MVLACENIGASGLELEGGFGLVLEEVCLKTCDLVVHPESMCALMSFSYISKEQIGLDRDRREVRAKWIGFKINAMRPLTNELCNVLIRLNRIAGFLVLPVAFFKGVVIWVGEVE